MTTSTYIVEIYTTETTKLVFVKADDRAKAIKAGKAAVSESTIKPAKARLVPDVTVNEMLSDGKYDMIDAR